MIKRYLFFSQVSCTKCPATREFLKTVNIPGDEIDATEDEGFEKARQHGAMATPTLIFYDENEKEIFRTIELQELKEFVRKNGK